MQPELEDKLNRAVSYVLLLLIVALGVSLFRAFSTHRAAQNRLSEAQTKLAEATAQQQELAAELEVTMSDEFREKQARDKLGLAREGETILVLPEPEILRRLAPPSQDIEDFVLPEPSWKQWLELFI